MGPVVVALESAEGGAVVEGLSEMLRQNCPQISLCKITKKEWYLVSKWHIILVYDFFLNYIKSVNIEFQA